MAKKTHLVIGGPKAGQRVTVDDKTKSFRTMKTAGSKATMEYVEQDFNLGPDTTFIFWVPSDQSKSTTFVAMLTAYERGHLKS
jgi:hypothetical protein